MLAQNMLTGQLHEIPEYGAAPTVGAWPDPQTYGLGEVYDGLGNSLGLFFLPKLIKGAVNAITGGGGGGGGLAPVTRVNCPPCPACPACGTAMPPGGMMRPGMPGFPFPYPPTRRRRRRR
jgi:hypothetical protein